MVLNAMVSTFFPTYTVEATFLKPLLSPSFHPDQRVGVHTIRNKSGAAIRIFYPAAAPSQSEASDVAQPLVPTRMFRTSLSVFFSGYIHAFSFLFPRRFLEVLNSIVGPLINFHPLNHSKIPRCFNNLPPSSKTSPLIVFSHGLTGTADEHSLFAAALALKGFTVALPHHSDGSSLVTDLETTCSVSGDSITEYKYFKHEPSYLESNYRNYDTTFRQKQAEHRAEEFEEARVLVLNSPLLKSSVSEDNVIAGGFSFGAATASIVASANPRCYRACILVDGWFNIRIRDTVPLVNLPTQFHENGTILPTLFIGSAAFDSFPNMRKANLEVQSKCMNKEVHVIEDTCHGNFMDAIYWVNPFLIRLIGFAGKKDAHLVYREFVGTVSEFAWRHADT